MLTYQGARMTFGELAGFFRSRADLNAAIHGILPGAAFKRLFAEFEAESPEGAKAYREWLKARQSV